MSCHHLRALLIWRKLFGLSEGTPGIVNQTVGKRLGVQRSRIADVYHVPLRVAACVVCVRHECVCDMMVCVWRGGGGGGGACINKYTHLRRAGVMLPRPKVMSHI